MVGSLGRIEKDVGDRHRHRGPQQRDGLHALRMAPRRLEDCQRAQAVTDQRSLLYTRDIEQCGEPFPNRLDRRGRLAAAPAVAGEIDREHVATMVREISRLQCPHAVVMRGAVHEHDRRQRGIETPRAGVSVD